jgi:chorismate mutase-like protein
MQSDEDALAELRRQIDEIDAQIHDLLMQRTEVAHRIGAIKGTVGNHIRPGREAAVLRRLIGRHRGALPKALIVRIWREIFAAVTAIQGNLAVAVYAPEGTFGYRNLARDHYGWRTPITAYRSAAQVLEAVAEGRATVGVLPVPRGEETDLWWRNLARNGEAVPRIVSRLPFAVVEPPRADNPEALAISLDQAEPTGLDRALLLLETNRVVSRSHLREVLAAAAFEVLDIQVSEEGGEHFLHLIEVDGFVPTDDQRLESLLSLGEGTVSQVWAVGGYAVPLSLEDMTGPGSDQALS